jgi:two-component system, sensor histidine kinase
MSRAQDSLLDISRLESGAVKPELRDFRVADLLGALRAEFAGSAAGKGLELRVEPSSASAYNDPTLIERILRSLLTSAFARTSAGRITLRARSERSALLLEVEYDGDANGHAADAPPPDIAQRLAKVLGLRLERASAPERGALFSLRVPRGRSAPRSTRAPSRATELARAGLVRVLLVEGDPLVRDATSMLLRVEGYGVTAVASLAEAVRSTAEAGAPDLLITDDRLGSGELGTQVIAALRKSLGQELRAVLVTGDAAAAAREVPSDPHLRIASKPYNAKELLGLLETLLAP